jgi:site-specific DNA recombinase
MLSRDTRGASDPQAPALRGCNLVADAQLCAREKCSARQVNMTISLAFLAPNLVKAAVEGRLPRGVGVERLRDPPTESRRQFEMLGLNPE